MGLSAALRDSGLFVAICEPLCLSVALCVPLCLSASGLSSTRVHWLSALPESRCSSRSLLQRHSLS